MGSTPSQEQKKTAPSPRHRLMLSALQKAPSGGLSFLLEFVNHFEDLFRDYSDEEVEAWVTANVADKFPTPTEPKSPRQWPRDPLED